MSQKRTNSSKKQTTAKPNQRESSRHTKKEGFKPSQSRSSGSMRGRQGKKDSSSKRVNYDNAREDRIADAIEQDSKRQDNNDITDFSAMAELIKAAGNLPFASIVGNMFGPKQAQVIPGVFFMYWAPSWGAGMKPVALNQASNLRYSFVVHANSRNYNYTAPDMEILTEAGAQVFSAIANAQRAYGYLKTYVEMNTYYPDSVIRMMGFDPVDIRQNLGQMWFDLNNLIAQVQQIWVPDNIPLVKRWFKLNSFFYQDATGMRSQAYGYVQRFFYMYSEDQYTTGSTLEQATIPTRNEAAHVDFTDTGSWKVYDAYAATKPITETVSGLNFTYNGYSWKQYFCMVQNMINRLVNSEDRGIIYGDMLNAYGSSKMWTLAPFTTDYAVAPQYNAEILMQMENATLCEAYPIGLTQMDGDLAPLWASGYMNMLQAPKTDEDTLINTTDSVNRKCGPTSQQLLNFHFPGQPTPEAIAVATRMKTGGLVPTQVAYLKQEADADGNHIGWTPTAPESMDPNAMLPSTTGTEIVTKMVICTSPWRFGNYGTMDFEQWYRGYDTWRTEGNGPNVALQLMAFDWHPFVYFAPYATQLSNINLGPVTVTEWSNDFGLAYGDFDNYSLVTDEDLDKMNSACLFSVMGAV